MGWLRAWWRRLFAPPPPKLPRRGDLVHVDGLCYSVLEVHTRADTGEWYAILMPWEKGEVRVLVPGMDYKTVGRITDL